MKFRWLFPALVVLWQCASSPQNPHPNLIDDDHRLVSRAEFAASAWTALPKMVSWQPLPSGASFLLKDGREASLTFPSPGVVRWWVAPGPGEQPLSPAARYPERGVSVTAQETGGILSLDTPSLGVRLKLSDLSWTLVRGDVAVLRTDGGPRMSGRRLVQAFASIDISWFGPGLESDTSAKFWISNDSDTLGPWAAPFLFGLGGVPFAIALDNSYQTYSRVTPEASLGALNGGLDLLIAASPQPEAVVGALTALTGRAPAIPSWAAATAVTLPPDGGAFIRQAKLSVGTSAGGRSAQFRQLVASPPPADDLTDASTRHAWTAWAIPGAGVDLARYSGSVNWTQRFDDTGRNSPLARMNNLIPTWGAKAAAEAATTPVPVLTASAGPGAVRWATPELAGADLTLPRALSLGLAGMGTPAARLDLSGLAADETRETAFHALLAWLMAPILTLDWGSRPDTLWNGLSDSDKKRLKTILDVRSQFQPLFVQATRQASATGVPAWRPIWFSAAHDPQAIRSDEFLLGDLLVAPVTPGAQKRQVYLPGPGVWFDFWTGEEFGGGRSYDVAFKTDRPLLYARGGAFVPTHDAEPYDGRDIPKPITMHVFPGGRGEGTYYVDDGVSAGKPGTFLEARLLFDYAQREMTLEHQTVSLGSLRAESYMLYRLHNVFKPRQVAIDNKVIPLYGPSWGVTESDRSAAWYEDDRTLLLKTFRPERNQYIQLSF